MFPFGAVTTIWMELFVRSVWPVIEIVVEPSTVLSAEIVKPVATLPPIMGLTPAVNPASSVDSETEVAAVVP